MKKRILGVGLAMVLGIMTLVGCSKEVASTDQNLVEQTAEGGVLCLKVNPEIAIEYDENGKVTAVEARNDDGSKILENFNEYVGKDCSTIVVELVKKIGEAGYFVEEIEGEKRNITVEIEEGSTLPNDTFLEDIAEDIRACVKENKWTNPVDLEGESAYGHTAYADTDYGLNNDGDTDYQETSTTVKPNDNVTSDANATNYDATDYGQTQQKPTVTQKPATTPSNTNYDSTDYGTNSDGVTDYNDDSNKQSNSNYESNTGSNHNDGNSNYTTPDIDDGASNYDDSDSDDGNSNYGNSNYGNSDSNDGNSNYDDSDSDDGASNYDDSDSDDGNSNYDNGESNYDD